MCTDQKVFTLRYPLDMEASIDNLQRLTGAKNRNAAIIEAIKIYLTDYQEQKRQNSLLSVERNKAQAELKELKNLIRVRKSIVKKINKLIK